MESVKSASLPHFQLQNNSEVKSIECPDYLHAVGQDKNKEEVRKETQVKSIIGEQNYDANLSPDQNFTNAILKGNFGTDDNHHVLENYVIELERDKSEISFPEKFTFKGGYLTRGIATFYGEGGIHPRPDSYGYDHAASSSSSHGKTPCEVSASLDSYWSGHVDTPMYQIDGVPDKVVTYGEILRVINDLAISEGRPVK